LQTYGEGNDLLEAGNDSVAQPVFNDGGAASSGDPAPWSAQTAVAQVGATPPSAESV
jgi:hypothetical protein